MDGVVLVIVWCLNSVPVRRLADEEREKREYGGFTRWGWRYVHLAHGRAHGFILRGGSVSASELSELVPRDVVEEMQNTGNDEHGRTESEGPRTENILLVRNMRV